MIFRALLDYIAKICDSHVAKKNAVDSLIIKVASRINEPPVDLPPGKIQLPDGPAIEEPEGREWWRVK